MRPVDLLLSVLRVAGSAERPELPELVRPTDRVVPELPDPERSMVPSELVRPVLRVVPVLVPLERVEERPTEVPLESVERPVVRPTVPLVVLVPDDDLIRSPLRVAPVVPEPVRETLRVPPRMKSPLP